MDRDRNLLFSVFAVQLKGVSPAFVMEAAAAWSTDPSISVGTRLVEKGLITEQDRALLERLVNEAIQAHGGNVAATLDSLGGEEQLRATLTSTIDSSRLDAMDTAPMTSYTFFTGRGTEVAGVAETPGRYTQISQHAKGGMGRVLLVHDEFLGRNIALKELLPVSPESGGSDRPSPMRQTASMVARFLQEARVTGQLEHPSIVPVYELGRRADGTLYYTMKLVKGKTLLQALRDCKTLQERLALLPGFMDLCQAIAYAHNRGVIHRDIKPANVMLGQFGETVVLDWGLAKVRDTQDVNLEDIENTLHFLELEEEDALPKTAYGRALGTPHYMPPEQAEGRVDAINERSDVYSLGAVLYEILTGTTPYTGKGTRDILDKVINAYPRPVLQVAPEVPPPLAMICEKALQKEPERRYQSAGELSEDVQRFVAGSLVRAYRYSLREIASHYFRKHRTMILTALTFLVALAGTGVYSYISIMQARDREHAQRLAAERAQREETIARRQEEREHARAERSNYVNQLHLANEYIKSKNQGNANKTADMTVPALRGRELGLVLNQANPEIQTVATPSEQIVSVSISPDDSLLATVALGETVQVWDLVTGALKTTCEGSDIYPAAACEFSPDSTRVMTAGADESVRIWAVGSGKLLHRLAGHPQRVVAAVFSEDGTQVLSGAMDGAVRFWNAVSGQPLSTLDTGFAAVHRLKLAPGGKAFAAVSNDGRVRVWDRATLGVLIEGAGTDLEFSADGQLLAVIDGRTATVWRLAAPAVVRQFAAASTINRLRFNRQANMLAAGFQDGAACVWDLQTGTVLSSVTHGAPIEDVFFTSGDGVVVTCARDNSFAAWDTASGAALNRMEGRGRDLNSVAFTKDGRRMVTASALEYFQIFDPMYRTGRRLLHYGATSCGAIAMAPNAGQCLVSGQTGSWLAGLDGSGVVKRFFGGPCGLSGAGAAAFSRDAAQLALTLDAIVPAVWRSSEKEWIQCFGHAGAVRALDFDASGERLVTASADGTARVWNAHTGEPITVLEGHTDEVMDACFSPDGKLVASVSRDGAAVLWDAASGTRVYELSGHKAGINACAFSPDGARLYTGSKDKTVRVWDTTSGRLAGLVAGQSGEVENLWVDAQNRVLFTATRDGASRIWDTRDFQLLASLHEVGRVATWPLILAYNDGRIERMETAQLAVSSPDPAAPTALFDAFRKNDYTQAAGLPLPSQIPGEQFTLISATKALWAIRSLSGALDTQATANGDAAAAVVLGDPIPYAAYYFLGLETGDVLRQAGGRPVSGFADAAAALAGQAGAWVTAPRPPLELLVTRGGREVHIVIDARDIRETSSTFDLAREDAVRLLQKLISGLVNRHVDVVWPLALEEAALDMGMGVGVEIPDSTDRAWLVKLGISGSERLIGIDNVSISRYDDALSRLRELEKRIAEGGMTPLTFDMQRGEFVRLHHEYTVR